MFTPIPNLPLLTEHRPPFPTFANELPPHLGPLRHYEGTPALLKHQYEKGAPHYAVKRLLKNQSSLLIAGTGEGKAFFGAYVVKDYLAKLPLGPKEYVLVVTKTTIVPQTVRVLKKFKNSAQVICISYAQLTSTIGTLFIDWKTKVVNGQPQLTPEWKQEPKLKAIICDEVQAIKNLMIGSQQAAIIAALANTNIPVLCMSATPYSRPIHVKAIALLLRPRAFAGVPLTEKMFPQWIASLCGEKSPNEWSPAAMKRVQAALEPYTLRFGKPIYKFHTRIHRVDVDFPDQASIDYYNEFYENWIAAQRAEGKDKTMHELVAMRKFEEAAEHIKAKHLADEAFKLQQEQNKAVIIACKYRETLNIVVSRLMNNGVKMSEISTIVGGQKDRQKNIDRFQKDLSKYMVLMFGAGGEGLSMHHNKEDNNNRPRVVFLPAVWNAEQFVQVLGRAHRITSESTTHQYVVCLRGTVEVAQYSKLKRKCLSLREVTKESAWTNMLKSAEALTHTEQYQLENGESEEDYSNLPVDKTDIADVLEEDDDKDLPPPIDI